MAGATVQIVSKRNRDLWATELTNRDGEFDFIQPPGEYQISAIAEGYRGFIDTFTKTAATDAPVRIQMVKLSTDCSKVLRTPVERLVCRDRYLFGLDIEMASAYEQVLRQLSPADQLQFRREHGAWFNGYSRTCNASVDDRQRAGCIAGKLSSRTVELNSRMR